MKALLALEDGFIFEGKSFTGKCNSGGEVIFNTGMTGYQEILTDPSYKGQVLCMTYPLIGNYGVNSDDMESETIHVAALIVKECCKHPSNWSARWGLPDFLVNHGVPGIEGVDTRALALHIRKHGSMRGFITTDVSNPQEAVMKAKQLPLMEGQNLAVEVMPKEPWVWKGFREKAHIREDGSIAWRKGKIPLVVYDFGIKWNIVRLLVEYGFDPLMVPATFSLDQVKASGAQAVFLSNGPGDPSMLVKECELISKLIDIYPTAGICLGHQLLGKSLGGKLFKLPFGHHGCNHPVKNLLTGHIEISSQNHGFCLDVDGINTLEVTHVNLNDDTLEGFRHKDLPLIAVQYHPEASPGPLDGQYFFKRFHDLVKKVGSLV